MELFKFGLKSPSIRSNQISRSVMSDSLRPHESQHARPPCPSPTPGVHSDSRPLSQWCHPANSSSVVPFSSCPQSLPASESFPMSQHFAWGGQSTAVSALASFLPKNTHDWSPLEQTGWISLQSKGLSRVFSTPQFKSIISWCIPQMRQGAQHQEGLRVKSRDMCGGRDCVPDDDWGLGPAGFRAFLNGWGKSK